jgi:hypothetical protein
MRVIKLVAARAPTPGRVVDKQPAGRRWEPSQLWPFSIIYKPQQAGLYGAAIVGCLSPGSDSSVGSTPVLPK